MDEKKYGNRHEKVNVRQQEGYEYETRVVDDVNTRRRITINRITKLIWLFFGIVEAFIGLRILLKLIAANPANPFANLVYTFSSLFVWPFVGLTITPEAQGMVFEISSIIAMLVYALVAWAIVRLVWLIFYHPQSRSVQTVERGNYTNMLD